MELFDVTRSVSTIVLCFGLTACGGGSGSSGGASQPDPPVARPSVTLTAGQTAYVNDRAQPVGTRRLDLTLRNTTSTGLRIFGNYTRRGIVAVDMNLQDPTVIALWIGHRTPKTLYNGTYTDQLTINVCLDQACNQPLDGSPLQITLTYTVTGTDRETGLTGPPPDPDADALSVQTRMVLSHNVVDAEYSRSLDRIVMAATHPQNALYIYDVTTETETSVPMAKAPTAVSVSPDGRTVAVGHDKSISIVDLTQTTANPIQVAISQRVFDIVLDGRGRAHVIPDVEDRSRLYSIDIASGAEHLSNFSISVFGQTYARLHPSGNYVFIGDPLISPARIDKWDITGDEAQYEVPASFDMAYIGACGNLWFDETGTRLYSQCGQVFETQGQPRTNLPQIGRLELSGPEITTDAFTIEWMDEFPARNEIALIEANASWCRSPGYGIPCRHRFGIFDSETLTRQSLYALPPIMVSGTLYTQHGLFVFNRSDGTSKYLLSRIDAIADPNAEFYLSTIE